MIELNKFKKIHLKRRLNCVICDTKLNGPIINMPKFPLTEIYIPQKINENIGLADQEFHLCKTCGHGQIVNIIDKEVLYGNCYKTRTSTSLSAIGAINIFLEFIYKIIGNKSMKNILEIGCNDLYILNQLRDRADKLYGIDPILLGKENLFRDDKIEVIGDFIENINLKNLDVKMDIILSSHTLEHIEAPKKLLQYLMDNSSNDTIFFFQFPSLEALIQDCRFDQIFHQHLNYFSLQSVIYMLEEVGAELIDFKLNPYHWGSLLIAFKKRKNKNTSSNIKFQKISKKFIKKQYILFKDCMNITSRRIMALSNETIYGYGAALMLPVLNYYIDELKQLKFIIDDDKNKKDLYYINLPIQIKLSEEIKNIEDSIILVTAINSLQPLRAIIKKLIQLNVKQIIIPINSI